MTKIKKKFRQFLRKFLKTFIKWLWKSGEILIEIDSPGNKAKIRKKYYSRVISVEILKNTYWNIRKNFAEIFKIFEFLRN